MIAFVMSTYAFIEYNNYVKYKKKSKIFNNFKHVKEHNLETIQNKINIIHHDIQNLHTDMKPFIQEMFRGFDKIEKIFKPKIISSLIDNLCFSHFCEQLQEKINLIVSDIENMIGIKFSENNNEVDVSHISITNENIVSWYKPFFLHSFLLFLKLLSSINMYLMGFHKYTLDNGLVIWKKNAKNNSDAILFVPSCVGGVTLYQYFINLLLKNIPHKTIYIIEIPGMSWTSYSSDIPPSVSNIAKSIVDFIIFNNHSNLDIVGHSFGTIVLSHIVNEQYNQLKKLNVKLNNVVYVEGLLFYVKVFETLRVIELSIFDILQSDTKSDIFTMPLFQRDLNVKFYIKRYLSLSNSVLCGDTECEKECKFFALMSQNDNKFITDDYVNYIESKKLNINYKVFENCSHGSFVWTKNMHNYLIMILRE